MDFDQGAHAPMSLLRAKGATPTALSIIYPDKLYDAFWLRTYFRIRRRVVEKKKERQVADAMTGLVFNNRPKT